jgi:hypothetical protein
MGASCGTGNPAQDAKLEAAGLVTNHAYGIKDIVSYPPEFCILELCNPWGVKEENTACAADGELPDESFWVEDNNPLWSRVPALRAAYKHRATDRSCGIQWMTLRNFVQSFKRVDVGKVYDDSRSITRIKVPVPSWSSRDGPQLYAVRIEVAATTHVDFGLYQQSARVSDTQGRQPLLDRNAVYPRDIGLAVVTEVPPSGINHAVNMVLSPQARQAELATGLRYITGCDRRLEPWVACEGELSGPTAAREAGAAGMAGSATDRRVYWVYVVSLNEYCDSDVMSGHVSETDTGSRFVALTISSAQPLGVELVPVCMCILLHKRMCVRETTCTFAVVLYVNPCNVCLQVDANDFNRALLCQTIALADSGVMAKDAPITYTMSEGAGVRTAVVNWSRDHAVRSTVEISEMHQMRHARGTGVASTTTTVDYLPPLVRRRAAVDGDETLARCSFFAHRHADRKTCSSIVNICASSRRRKTVVVEVSMYVRSN